MSSSKCEHRSRLCHLDLNMKPAAQCSLSRFASAADIYQKKISSHGSPKQSLFQCRICKKFEKRKHSNCSLLKAKYLQSLKFCNFTIPFYIVVLLWHLKRIHWKEFQGFNWKKSDNRRRKERRIFERQLSRKHMMAASQSLPVFSLPNGRQTGELCRSCCFGGQKHHLLGCTQLVLTTAAQIYCTLLQLQLQYCCSTVLLCTESKTLVKNIIYSVALNLFPNCCTPPLLHSTVRYTALQSYCATVTTVLQCYRQ